ncbi:hypothetical protein WME94_26895 [Sorangium sp. So ce429]
MAIGRRLGFDAATEVSFEVDTGYAPRLDVLWSSRLTPGQRAALRAVGAAPPLSREKLPVGAWEVEGSDASTKSMQADLANMRVFGAYLNFLAVRADTPDNLFTRAVRLAATQAHYFGDRRGLVLDLSWIAELAGLEFTNTSLLPAPSRKTEGSGGTGTWAKVVTVELTRRAIDAGFLAIPEFQAPRLDADLTQSKIDLVWALPLPAGFAAFVQEIRRRCGLPASADCLLLPVVGFEIENASSKHGHGGLLNLASHAMSGVFVPGTVTAAYAAEAAKATYARAYPLASVTIHKEFMR